MTKLPPPDSRFADKLDLVQLSPHGTNDQPDWSLGTLTAKQLQSMQFSPISWIVPKIIPAEGVTLLCSKPKFGKSWLVYDLCIACTTDRFTLGTIKPKQGDVLYLALEDSKRRLQRRLAKLLPTFGSAWPDKLLLKTEWRRLHEGGVDDVRAWHTHTKSVGGKPIMVVIDVLAKVRKPIGKSQLYEADYAALADLTKLANELGLAIVVLHHTRKMAADDLVEMVSGSFGVSGAADTILVMANKPNGDVLDIRGRDVESAEMAIEFDKRTCRWRVLGNAKEVHVSSQRAKVIAALQETGSAMTITALMDATGMKRNPLEILLGRMVRDGAIKRIGKGQYARTDYMSPATDDPPSEEKLGRKRSRSVASVQPSRAATDNATDASSEQLSEWKDESRPPAASVASVRKSKDTDHADRMTPLSATAQTDRTDGQMGAQTTEYSEESGALDLSHDLSRCDRETDRRQTPIKGPGALDDFPELPASLRRQPIAPTEPPQQLSGSSKPSQEEETTEWTL
jgi:hypothetical protein